MVKAWLLLEEEVMGGHLQDNYFGFWGIVGDILPEDCEEEKYQNLKYGNQRTQGEGIPESLLLLVSLEQTRLDFPLESCNNNMEMSHRYLPYVG